jgi:hypothetical protein
MKPIAAAALILLLTSCDRRPAPGQDASPVRSQPETEVQQSVLPEVRSDRNSLLGTWQLLTFEQMENDGSTSHPYGDMPMGRLTFDAAGRMSVFVMKPGRFASVNSTAAISRASVEDLRQIADGFIAYYGEFQVDDQENTLITKVEAATIPAWSGSEQKRIYELDGSALTLITPATRLTWMKLPN